MANFFSTLRQMPDSFLLPPASPPADGTGSTSSKPDEDCHTDQSTILSAFKLTNPQKFSRTPPPPTTATLKRSWILGILGPPPFLLWHLFLFGSAVCMFSSPPMTSFLQLLILLAVLEVSLLLPTSGFSCFLIH